MVERKLSIVREAVMGESQSLAVVTELQTIDFFAVAFRCSHRVFYHCTRGERALHLDHAE